MDLDGLADKAKGHIHDFFGCVPNLGQNKNPYSNESDFFNPNSSSKDLMVELAGLYSNTFRRIANAKKSPPQEAEIVEKRKNIDDRVKNERGEVEVKRYRQRQIILSEKGRKEVICLYLEGVNTYTIAKSFGCHRNTVSRILKDAGVNVTIEKINLDEAIRLYESGWTTKQIAEKYDMSNNAVSRRLRAAGVKCGRDGIIRKISISNNIIA